MLRGEDKRGEKGKYTASIFVEPCTAFSNIFSIQFSIFSLLLFTFVELLVSTFYKVS